MCVNAGTHMAYYACGGHRTTLAWVLSGYIMYPGIEPGSLVCAQTPLPAEPSHWCTKAYVLDDSTFVTFSRLQNNRSREDVDGCQGLRQKEGGSSGKWIMLSEGQPQRQKCSVCRWRWRALVLRVWSNAWNWIYRHRISHRWNGARPKDLTLLTPWLWHYKMFSMKGTEERVRRISPYNLLQPLPAHNSLKTIWS